MQIAQNQDVKKVMTQPHFNARIDEQLAKFSVILNFESDVFNTIKSKIKLLKRSITPLPSNDNTTLKVIRILLGEEIPLTEKVEQGEQFYVVDTSNEDVFTQLCAQFDV